VPRTRLEEPREAKTEAILDLAEATLRNDGPDALSVARIARELDVAQNSIYWYFKDRDGLLVAVLERSSKRALDDLSRLRSRGPIELIVAAVDRIAALGPLEAAMRARASASDKVAAFERTFDASIRSLLRDVLASEVAPGQLERIAEVVEMVAAGCLARNTPTAQRRRILRHTLHALLDSA
jgi:AcrR family transcriptional regulator